MTAPASTEADTAAGRHRAVRRAETRLRDASLHLQAGVSSKDVRAARRAIDDAERALGSLVHDPWEPSAGPLREAREILSSHLLAAAACEGADVAPPVTARVLRKGAESARRALSRLDAALEAEPHP